MPTAPAKNFFVINYSASPRMASGRKDNCILPVDFDEIKKLDEVAALLFEAGKSKYDEGITLKTIEVQVREICYKHANETIYKKGLPFFELDCDTFKVFLQLESSAEKYLSAFEKIAAKV